MPETLHTGNVNVGEKHYFATARLNISHWSTLELVEAYLRGRHLEQESGVRSTNTTHTSLSRVVEGRTLERARCSRPRLPSDWSSRSSVPTVSKHSTMFLGITPKNHFSRDAVQLLSFPRSLGKVAKQTLVVLAIAAV